MQRLQKTNTVFLILLLLFIADACYSSYQHYRFPVDGDLASIVVPIERYEQVLKDPYGIEILETGKTYAATNRFYTHWFIYHYFRQVPLWLQTIVSPVDSIYTSIALAKIVIQLGLILLLGAYIQITLRLNKNEFMVATLLMTTLFQTSGFAEYMSVIDISITYTLFYALGIFTILIFFFPYYRAALTGYSGLPNWIKPLWLISPCTLPFSSALVAPTFMILCPAILIFLVWKNFQQHRSIEPIEKRIIVSVFSIHWQVLSSLGLAILFSVYSFYIGTFNIETIETLIPLSERYDRLMQGLVVVSTRFSEGLMPLVVLVCVNLLLFARQTDQEAKMIRKILMYVFLFSVTYIALLPFGGYRFYRPYIIRRDTLLPVLLPLFFAWGMTSIYLLRHFAVAVKRYTYAAFLLVVSFFYMKKDNISDYTNDCERRSIQRLAESKTDCLLLEDSCPVMQWNNTDCSNTIYAAKMLYHWKVTSQIVTFHHKQ